MSNGGILPISKSERNIYLNPIVNTENPILSSQTLFDQAKPSIRFWITFHRSHGLLVPFPPRPTINLNRRVPGRRVVSGSFGSGGTSDGSSAAAINSPIVQMRSVTPNAIADVMRSVSCTRQKL
jgi:hypothetical protein